MTGHAALLVVAWLLFEYTARTHQVMSLAGVAVTALSLGLAIWSVNRIIHTCKGAWHG